MKAVFKLNFLLKLGVILISILMFSFIREGLILIYPILLVLIIFLFKIKFKDISVLSMGLVLLGSLFTLLFDDGYLSNTIMSLLIFYLPIIVLLSPAKKFYISLESFMSISSRVLLLINISALIAFLINIYTKNHMLDDGFTGLYGRSGLMMHTLSLVNFIYSVFFFYSKKYKLSLFFFWSAFMCFYGLGLLVFIITVMIVLGKTIKLSKFKYVFSLIPLGLLIIFTIKAVNPTILTYMNNNITNTVNGVVGYSYSKQIKLAKANKLTNVPRKITAFAGGLKRLKEPRIFVLGTGPGSYNSRTSFLLNGEYSKMISFSNNKGNRPKYAECDVFPLWNKGITYKYNDGTRNQPFSSILALLVEYGVINFILIIVLFINLLRRNYKNRFRHYYFFNFLMIFILLNLLTENYIEYPEFFLLIILIVKIIESEKFKTKPVKENIASIDNGID